MELLNYRCLKRLLLNKSFAIVCLVGLMYQVTYITVQYESYTTVSRVAREVPDEMPPPNIAVCLKYPEILNYSFILTQKDVNVDYHPDISQIFNYTPAASESIVRCSYRKARSNMYHEAHGKYCLQIFNITKFFLQDYLCYRIEQVVQDQLSFQMIATSLYHSGAIYDIIFDRRLLKSTRMKVILFYGSYPFFSKKLAKEVEIHFRPNSTEMLHNYFTASFSFYDVTLLPAPYDSKCNGTGEEGSEYCYQLCMEAALRIIHRAPFSGIITDAMEQVPFGVDDFLNPKSLSLFDQKEKECRSPCSYEVCFNNYTVTQVESERGDDSELRIRAIIATQPTVRILTDPRISFSSYLIYASSCLGTWLGLAIIHFDPFNNLILKRIVRRRFSRRKVCQKSLRVVCTWKLIHTESQIIS